MSATTCCKEYTIITTSLALPYMPLNSAVYEAGRDAIFAVFGGRVFRHHATTGAIISESRYGGPSLSDTYIAYDSGRDKLWVTYSPSFTPPPSTSGDKYIYKLNPDTFAIEQTIGLSAQSIGPSFEGYCADDTIRNLVINGVYLMFSKVRPQSTNGVRWTAFNPDALPGETFYDSETTAKYAGTAVYGGFYYVGNDDTGYIVKQNGLGVNTDFSGSYLGTGIFGFCWSGSFFYAATRSSLIVKLQMGAPYGASAIDTLLLGADIWNCRYNANDGLIYAPDFANGKVVVLNPADDSFTVKPGFDAPWDCVFTPTKKWSLQHSGSGLKEIT